MAQFTVTIADAPSLAGITAARAAYNAALPDVMDDSDPPKPIAPKPGTLATDNEYVQLVMASAAQSYAKQYGKV